MEKNNKFEVGQVYDLPVKERRNENKQSYYIIEVNNQEYAIRLFDFQKDDPMPATLPCYVKENHEGTLVLTQDYEPLLRRFYEEKKIYTFWVKNDLTNIPDDYYEISDWNGFTFRLHQYNNTKLVIRQRIECYVQSISHGFLNLTLIQNINNEAPTCQSPAKLLSAAGLDPALIRWTQSRLLNSKRFQNILNIYQEGREEWIFHLLEKCDSLLSSWINADNKRTDKFLKAYRSVCLYLLEGSSFLKHYSTDERKHYQIELANYVKHIDEFTDAWTIFKKGEVKTFIDNLFDKMRKSGFLYQPKHQLHVLTCIFSIDSSIMEKSIPDLFHVIQDGDPDNWATEPFRSALIEQLEYYINKRHQNIDHESCADDDRTREQLKYLIKALSIQLLLAKGTDAYDRQLNRAMLYRILTQINGSYTNNLLEKAFRCLANADQEMVEYNWNDASDELLLALKLSNNPVAGTSSANLTQTYMGQKAQLRIINGDIMLLPLKDNGHTQYKALPDNLLPWHNLQILSAYKPEVQIKSNTKDLVAYQKLWLEAERSLFESKKKKQIGFNTKRKLSPDVHDMVLIKVLYQDNINPEYFHCKIEDPKFEGTGMLNIHNIVRYNIRTDISAFRNDNNLPLKINAEIISIDSNGQYVFSLLGPIGNYLHEELSFGTELDCIISDVNSDRILCICEYGFSLSIDQTPELENLTKGMYIVASVKETRSTGMVYGTYVGPSDATFLQQYAFCNLLLSYTDGEYYEPISEPQLDEQQPEAMMEPSYARELIMLTERKGMLEKDVVATFNYLAYARLMALTIDDNELATYYAHRMKFLQLMQQFAIDRTIDEAKLQDYGKQYPDMLSRYPDMRDHYTQLLLLNCLDKSGQEDYLWSIMRGKNYRLASIAQLVFSYNMLNNFCMVEEKEAIRKKISEQLNISAEEHKTYNFGLESQQLEFKTSIVFSPTSKMRPDLEHQTERIMQVICGFLNAEGGSLLLGVNDQGVASGLAEDLRFFDNSQDKFDLYVRNQITLNMGKLANALVSISYPEAGDKLVYCINIKASPKPIDCKGLYFLRAGSSTQSVDTETLEISQARRRPDKVTNLSDEAIEDCNRALEENRQVQETTSDDNTSLVSKYHEEQLATSRLRRNVVFNYEDGFGVEMAALLHFLPKGKYCITSDTYWNDVLLSLAIHEDEKDGYLIEVYEDGKVLSVPIEQILSRTESQEYKRYDYKKPIFVSPARKDDALFMGITTSGHKGFRLDDVKNIATSDMQSEGSFLTECEIDKVILCEIIPAEYVDDLHRIHNLRYTQSGPDITTAWGDPERKVLAKLGIDESNL